MSGIYSTPGKAFARELVKLGGNHMSVSEDRESVAPAVQPAAAGRTRRRPGPLGLAAFALTTFLLSTVNARWTIGNSAGTAFLGYALAYGGLAQLLAGMWEFRNRNVFGATAFSSYGAFWIGLFVWIRTRAAPTTGHDLGWILLAFAIFNTYMLILSSQVNLAVFLVFLTLELTEIVLAIGNFASSPGWTQFGGYLGIITAAAAWYTSAAGRVQRLERQAQAPRRQAADLAASKPRALIGGNGVIARSTSASPRSPPVRTGTVRPVSRFGSGATGGLAVCRCTAGRNLTCLPRWPW